MDPSAYDVIVVSGGAIGLSAAHHCARAGKKVPLLQLTGNFLRQNFAQVAPESWIPRPVSAP